MSVSIYVPAEEEFKRNPDLKKSDLQSLKDWYEKQDHLPKITDSELILFLHSNYYRLEPTKVTIDAFYTTRTHIPEFFYNRDPITTPELRQLFEVMSFIPLKEPTKEGYKVIFCKLLNADPSKFNYNDFMKFYIMSLDLWMFTEGTTKGHVIVYDLTGVSLGHATRINPLGLKKFLFYLQDALPVRLKAIHYLNSNAFFDMILNMAKPFMKKELVELLNFHSDLESFNKMVPVEILPNEVGGKAGPLLELHKAEVKKIENHRNWFLEDEQLRRVDESKRAGKGKTATDLFGVEGSFKKLDID